VELEKRGVPTVTIVGTTFVPIAKYESEGLGLAGLPLAVVEYPMGGVPAAEAQERARRAFGQILAGLSEPEGGRDGEAT
jgi:hypothetical protein